ncbi:MAG: hypothetical protein HPY45_08150 [Anaerolineae bacterium]|nr:hypothetical protein [Anaerolineae bacterium]
MDNSDQWHKEQDSTSSGSPSEGASRLRKILSDDGQMGLSASYFEPSSPMERDGRAQQGSEIEQPDDEPIESEKSATLPPLPPHEYTRSEYLAQMNTSSLDDYEDSEEDHAWLEMPLPGEVNEGDELAGWKVESLEEEPPFMEQSQTPEETKKSDFSVSEGWKETEYPEEPPETPLISPLSGGRGTRRPATDRIGDTKPNAISGQTRPVVGGAPRQPLPEWKPVVDRGATRVTPSAYGIPSQRVPPPSPPRGGGGGYGRPLSPRPSSGQPPSGGGESGMSIWGCLLRLFIAIVFVAILFMIVVVSVAVFQYYSLVNSPQFPDVRHLKEHAAQFETTRILDRNGNPLYEILDPSAGRRTYIDLKPGTISPYIIAATIATEDKEYYNHPGYDPVAIVRALWQNYTTGKIVSGASTITQQLARVLLLSPEERGEKTVQRKALEIVLAAEITRLYSKEEILELYLNQIYYGNLAYGIEAAAQTYFHTSASRLTLAQSAFLAGLPQAPAVYDIFQNREETLRRFEQVLRLMYEASREQGCIYVSTNIDKVCISEADVARAREEIYAYRFELDQNVMRYPHWVTYIQSLLRDQFGYTDQMIYSSGLTVYTTLDPAFQEVVQRIVSEHVRGLADRNVKNGALVVIKPASGEILAMVGSPDFDDPQTGQINMAVVPRQPGSAIKPLTYTAAFEKGWTPATLIWDIPSRFPPSGDPNDTRPPYEPKNYDDEFHGPVTVRIALANSYNIPAVKTLQFVGIYDKPEVPGEDGLVAFARRLGISTLTRPDYGLSLTLGGGEVSLLELTAAYAVYANGGWRVPPVAITKILNYKNEVLYEYKPPDPYPAVQPKHAYLISSILSDNQAREAEFGTNSVLNLPFQAAVKTGTSNDFRDNWTLGYTPDIAVGVWVGNADNTPMRGTSGVTGAGPIWADSMRTIINTFYGGVSSPFVKPNDVVERTICAMSGTEPSEWCPSQRVEVFAADQPPLPKEYDFWRKVKVDTWTGLLASHDCSEFVREEFVLNVSDQEAVDWIKNTEQGRRWAAGIGFNEPIALIPSRECRIDDPRPIVRFEGIFDGQTITYSPLDIYGIVDATEGFKDFVLQYGLGDEPSQWIQLGDKVTQQIKYPDILYVWFLDGTQNGRVTLRLYLASTEDGYAEKRIHLNLLAPTSTPTVTPTLTPTPVPTQTPIPTEILIPTITPP